MLKTGATSFVMELPGYKVPSLRSIWLKVYEGGAAFVKGAGTIIVAATIIVWAAAYFPRDVERLPSGLMDRKNRIFQIQRLERDPQGIRKRTELKLASLLDNLLSHQKKRVDHARRAIINIAQIQQHLLRPMLSYKVGQRRIQLVLQDQIGKHRFQDLQDHNAVTIASHE